MNQKYFDSFYYSIIQEKRNLMSGNHEKLQVVFVTGSLGGIGRSICELYHKKCFYVIGIDLAEKSNCEFIDWYLKVDLYSDEYYFSEMIDEGIFHRLESVLDKEWNLVSVIHCAAYQYCGSLLDAGSGDFSDTMPVNVLSVLRLNQVLFPYLKRDRGSIVVVGSVHTVSSSEGMAIYAMSKCALVGLVRNTCLEWAKHGIRINMVSPGAVDTPMLRSGLSGRANVNLDGFDMDDPEIREEVETEIDEMIDLKLIELEDRHLNGEIGEPSEVATIIYFLGDNNQSKLINGQNIIADGGVSGLLSTEV